MKLTGEYFSNKLNELAPLFKNLASGLNDSPEIMDVLAQIARDAAEEQRLQTRLEISRLPKERKQEHGYIDWLLKFNDILYVVDNTALAIPDGE